MHDLIYCFRMLRKRPSFTVVGVLTLALAIGAGTALFSIVNVVVLNPFPYKDPSQLFFVRQSFPRSACRTSFALQDRRLSALHVRRFAVNSVHLRALARYSRPPNTDARGFANG
jgi:hypothetical protein